MHDKKKLTSVDGAQVEVSFELKVNSFDEEFNCQFDAEARILYIAGARNHLEEELRNY